MGGNQNWHKLLFKKYAFPSVTFFSFSHLISAKSLNQNRFMKTLFLFAVLFLVFQSNAQDLKPTLTQAVLKVKVVNDKNVPQAGQVVTFKSLKDGKEFSRVTDDNGKFSMLIPPAQKYKVQYKVFTTMDGDLELDLPASEKPYSFTYNITVTPPKTYRLDNVFFDSGKSSLRAESSKELNELAEYMSLKKTLVIEIAGHTDNVGAADANQKLSEDRANSVKQYLVKKGISAERVQAKGYGDTQPVADNETAAGKQKNRRTEVRIITE
jgi:OOP family OmpA-OmpF porin